MQLLQIQHFPFAPADIDWSGPFLWNSEAGAAPVPAELAGKRGLYRLEKRWGSRRIIKFIGSTSGLTFATHLNAPAWAGRRLLLDRGRTDIFLGLCSPDEIARSPARLRQLECILREAHRSEVMVGDGLKDLPASSRGSGWRIRNRGARGKLIPVIVYPAIAVSF